MCQRLTNGLIRRHNTSTEKARTSCLLLSACEDGEAEGGAASDDFCWKTENFRQRVRRGRQGREGRGGWSRKTECRGGEDRETELIRGNERGFSRLQRGTRQFSGCCEQKVIFQPTAAQKERRQKKRVSHSRKHTGMECRDDPH